MDEIILVGAGGHAHACIDVIEQAGLFSIAGLIEKNINHSAGNLGYTVLGADKDLEQLHNKYRFAIITVGQIKSPDNRINLYKILKSIGYTLPLIISPIAYVSKYATIGEGTIIAHGVVVNANAKVGRNCIINTKSLIEHDAVIEDHCHIATGAIINGEVKIGEGSFIGSGVVTKHSIKIGNNCVIGAGATLKTDVESNQVIKN